MTNLENPFKQPPKRRLFGSKPKEEDSFDSLKTNEDLDTQLFEYGKYKLNLASFKLINGLKSSLFSDVIDMPQAQRDEINKSIIDNVLEDGQITEDGRITWMYLEGDQSSIDVLESLSQNIKKAGVEHLSFDSANLRGDGKGEAIARLIRNSVIKDLVFNDERMSREMAEQIGEALPDSEVSSLSMRGTTLNDDGVLALCRKMPQSKVEDLILLSVSLTEPGLHALMLALDGSKVRKFSFFQNNFFFTSDIASFFAKLFKDSSIEKLNIYPFLNSSQHYEKFMQEMKGSKLKELVVGSNKIAKKLREVSLETGIKTVVEISRSEDVSF